MKQSEASLKQAEEITGGQLEYYDTKNVPEKFKKASYPTPWLTPEHPDAEDDQEIDDTLDSIRQAEIIFGYKKETRNWHKEGNKWDYYNHVRMSDQEAQEKDALHAATIQGKGPEAGKWWKRLTKDNGLNGMDAIPKGRQGDSSDEEEDDNRIPKDVKDKQKRIAMEKNGGKKPEKHAESKQCDIPEMCPDDMTPKE
tara:strand:- start:910 stop:1500 length:591 start_codon:yes stop_codon:yes gene_type:complete